MSKQDIIRAWKDEEYREGLSESELSRLPQNPAGSVELADSQLSAVGGYTTWGCALAVSLAFCGSLFGTCAARTSGCC